MLGGLACRLATIPEHQALLRRLTIPLVSLGTLTIRQRTRPRVDRSFRLMLQPHFVIMRCDGGGRDTVTGR
jgi:hypothetical protein